eukprot:TRINITY_DN2831_c0_g1_i1.p1 TRINITY_DN2831_c0_g1~~TRINITY_DN2831_c0_g1_i1.p1  ORF type:complete len:435 (-),score=66.63 TRINITY_DN2831_c0_g1_i1:508-1812(-)
MDSLAAQTAALQLTVDPRDVGRPEKYIGTTPGDWEAWAFGARPFIALLGIFTSDQLKAAEAMTQPIVLHQLPDDVQYKCHWLWFLLTQYLTGTAAKIMKSVEQENGLEAWRKVARHFLAAGGATQAGVLDQILHFDFASGSFGERLLDFDLMVKAYNDQFELEDVSDRVLKSLVIAGAPEALKVQLQVLPAATTCRQIRTIIDDFLAAQLSWKQNSAHSVVSSTSSSGSAMDLNAILAVLGEKGKGKGKGKNKKGKTRGKTTQQPAARVICFRCGERGHVAGDCRVDASEFLDMSEPETVDEDPWSVQCWYCGGWGHRARRCSSRLSRRDLDALYEHSRILPRQHLETLFEDIPEGVIADLTEQQKQMLHQVRGQGDFTTDREQDWDLQSLGTADSEEEPREGSTTEAPNRQLSSGEHDDLAPQLRLEDKQIDT